MTTRDKISPVRLHNFKIFDRVFFGDQSTEFREIVFNRSHIEATFSVDQDGKVSKMRLGSPMIKIIFWENRAGSSQIPFSVCALELRNNSFVVNQDYVPHPDITDALSDLIFHEECMKLI